MTSPDFWVLLRNLAGNNSSSAAVFEILEGGVSGTPSPIIADNYEAAIALLNDFASAAKVGAVAEQKGDAGSKRSRTARPKKETPRYVHGEQASRSVCDKDCSDSNKRKRHCLSRREGHQPDLQYDLAHSSSYEAITPGS
jgi:hypothetical protein